MNVRVCGPNLRDQSKGSFHVHADGCADLRKYGPHALFGGEQWGEEEMLVKDATIAKVVVATYSDQIAEQPSEEESEYAENLVNDFWFAPCCAKWLHQGSFENELAPAGSPSPPLPGEALVFECWINGVHDSFVKLTDPDEVAGWTRDHILQIGIGKTLTIGVHQQSEYQTTFTATKRTALTDLSEDR